MKFDQMMKTVMTTTLVVIIIISLLITAASCGGGGGTATTDPAGISGLVNSTCNNTPNYNLCIHVLSADHRSGSPEADVSTLATVVVDAVKAESQRAADEIGELRRGRGRDLKAAALEKCDFEYNKVILGAVLAEAYEALKKGNPKFAEDAMVGTASSAQSCQEAFGTGAAAAASPLSPINARVRDLSVVARAIIRNLL